MLSMAPKHARLLTVAFLAVLLGACGTSPEQDRGPSKPIDFSHLPDAVPKKDRRTRAGNKNPYTVLGKTYQVLPDSKGFRQQGEASWYGKKFHGRNTSNGEVYDMYAMTAAHKTLPIPSYVRVTNHQNGRSVVVRVNDRGPFHGGRIIDLSYAAASKLGFAELGTARVSVEAIDTGNEPVAHIANAGAQANVVKPKTKGSAFVQVGAFSQYASAQNLLRKLQAAMLSPVALSQKPGSELYRVRVGPLSLASQLNDVKRKLRGLNLGSGIVVYE